MRNSFVGYYDLTEEELNALWKDGIIVLDTNVLLNLYRYSKEARKSLLELITALQGQLWIPHQVALEYHRNRLPRIYDERRNCDATSAEFLKLLNNLDESRRHPFVSTEFRKKLDEILQELKSEIDICSTELDAFKRNDPILEQLTLLYEGKVGDAPLESIVDAWLAEGELRYKKQIPPGFEDRTKIDDKKYGDLLIWKQILDHAQSKQVPVIFVTDDAKKDWWREQYGETIGPHPLLKEEITKATGKPFHMYRPERFVKFAGESIKRPIPDQVVEEVKNIRIADETEVSRKIDDMKRTWKWTNEQTHSILQEDSKIAERAVMEAYKFHKASLDPTAEVRKIFEAEEAAKRAMEAYKVHEDSVYPNATMRKIFEAEEAARRALEAYKVHENSFYPNAAMRKIFEAEEAANRALSKSLRDQELGRAESITLKKPPEDPT